MLGTTQPENKTRSRILSDESFGSPKKESHVDTPTLAISDKETLRLMSGLKDP